MFSSGLTASRTLAQHKTQKSKTWQEGVLLLSANKKARIQKHHSRHSLASCSRLRSLTLRSRRQPSTRVFRTKAMTYQQDRPLRCKRLEPMVFDTFVLLQLELFLVEIGDDTAAASSSAPAASQAAPSMQSPPRRRKGPMLHTSPVSCCFDSLASHCLSGGSSQSI